MANFLYDFLIPGFLTGIKNNFLKNNKSLVKPSLELGVTLFLHVKPTVKKRNCLFNKIKKNAWLIYS